MVRINIYNRSQGRRPFDQNLHLSPSLSPPWWRSDICGLELIKADQKRLLFTTHARPSASSDGACKTYEHKERTLCTCLSCIPLKRHWIKACGAASHAAASQWTKHQHVNSTDEGGSSCGTYGKFVMERTLLLGEPMLCLALRHVKAWKGWVMGWRNRSSLFSAQDLCAGVQGKLYRYGAWIH